MIGVYILLAMFTYLLLGWLVCHGKHDGDTKKAYKEWNEKWNKL